MGDGQIAANDIGQPAQAAFYPFKIFLCGQGFLELPDHMQAVTRSDDAGGWQAQAGNGIFHRAGRQLDILESTSMIRAGVSRQFSLLR